jgi:hypothetical protein
MPVLDETDMEYTVGCSNDIACVQLEAFMAGQEAFSRDTIAFRSRAFGVTPP